MNRESRKRKIEAAFEEHQRILYHVAWQVWSIYGGDFDDYFGQAQIIFMDAFDDFHADKGAKLSTWLFYKVRRGLIDYVRKQRAMTRGESHKIDEVFLETYSTGIRNFSMIEFLDELNEDAHIVLELFLNTPRKVFGDIRNKYTRLDHVQYHLRNRLSNILHQMGWKRSRINAAFDELRRATQ
jgi:RNA polymerase sigma factor (sigma-70 family)